MIVYETLPARTNGVLPSESDDWTGKWRKDMKRNTDKFIFAALYLIGFVGPNYLMLLFSGDSQLLPILFSLLGLPFLIVGTCSYYHYLNLENPDYRPDLSLVFRLGLRSSPGYLLRIVGYTLVLYITALFANLFISGLPLPPSVVYWTTTVCTYLYIGFINSPLANRIIKGPPLKITFKGFVFALLCAIPDAAAGVIANWLINRSLEHPLWALCLIIPPVLYLLGPQLILWNLKNNLWPEPEQDA